MKPTGPDWHVSVLPGGGIFPHPTLLLSGYGHTLILPLNGLSPLPESIVHSAHILLIHGPERVRERERERERERDRERQTDRCGKKNVKTRRQMGSKNEQNRGKLGAKTDLSVIVPRCHMVKIADREAQNGSQHVPR